MIKHLSKRKKKKKMGRGGGEEEEDEGRKRLFRKSNFEVKSDYLVTC